jgi:hypothetical protein
MKIKSHLELAFLAAAAMSFGPADAAQEIVIGASLLLLGPLVGFGMYQKWGCETAVKDVNAAAASASSASPISPIGRTACKCCWAACR